MELSDAGYDVTHQQGIPVIYCGHVLAENAFRADLIVADQLILKLKNVKDLAAIHQAQILNYIRLAEVRRGLLINFIV